MRNATAYSLLLFLLVSASNLACAQPAEDGSAEEEATEQSDVDRERLIENLKLQIPQLRQAQQVTIGPLKSSEVPGFQQTIITVNGSNQVAALVRDDGQQILLLAGPPIDASRSIAEVQDQLKAETEEQQATLSEASKGMPVRGNPEAPVTMISFADFQCPYCARSTSLIDEVLATYPERVKFVFMHYPLPNHGWAKPAAIAAQCAARQSEEAFWTLHDAYFANQGRITEQNVIEQTARFLQDTDIDLDAWRTCATDDASAAHQTARQTVEQSLRTGDQVGVRGTPTFFIDGEKMQGPRSLETFGARIEEAASE